MATPTFGLFDDKRPSVLHLI